MDALGGGRFLAVSLLQGVRGVRLLAAAAVELELEARLDVIVAGHSLLGILEAAFGAAAFLRSSGGVGFQRFGLRLGFGQTGGGGLPR